MWTTPLVHIAPIREGQRGARLHLQYSRQSNEPHLNGHSDCISRQTHSEIPCVYERTPFNVCDTQQWPRRLLLTMRSSRECPAAGTIAVRANGARKTNQRKEEEKKNTHTGAQAMVLSKCKRRIRERKKNAVCSFLLLSRRVRCCCFFNIRTLLCGGAHTTEASRGLLPRGVRPQERDAETREAVMSRSGCKERQGGQWRAHYPLPSSVDRAGEQGDVRAARTQDRAARLSRRCHDTEFIRGND